MESPLLFDSMVFVQSPLGVRMQGLSELYNDPATFDMAFRQPMTLHVAQSDSTLSTGPCSSPTAFDSPPIAPDRVQFELIPSVPFSPPFLLSNPLQFSFPPPPPQMQQLQLPQLPQLPQMPEIQQLPQMLQLPQSTKATRPSDFILRGFEDSANASKGKRRRSDNPSTEEATINENDTHERPHVKVVEDSLNCDEVREARAFFPCSSRGAQLQATASGLPVFMLRNDRVDNQFRPCYIHFTYLSAAAGVPNLRIWLTIHGIAYEMAWTIITGKFKPRIRISVTHLLRERPNILCARRMPVRATVEFKRGDTTVTSRQCVLECAFRNRISVGI